VVLVLATIWWWTAGRRSYDVPSLAGQQELARYADEVV
jgi:hypothetical protein